MRRAALVALGAVPGLDMKRAVLTEAGLEPRGLSREEAAAYIGVSATKFDELVGDGRMPRPKRIDARRVWDRREVDIAFTRLPTGASNDAAQADPEDEWSRPAA